MASIPTGIILIWTGSNASIPSGWTRETSLDAKFPKSAAASTEANVTGGADTHSHTSPAHTHVASAHAHSGQTSRDGAFETEGGGSQAARDAHVHDWSLNNITGGNLVDAISYQATSSLPPYHEVIFIKPDGVPAPLADGIASYFNETSLPYGWHWCDGLNSTPDLRNKYLRGAAAGQDAGTTGGSLNHSHTVNHTHSAVSHTHTGTTGYDSDHNPAMKRETWAGGGPAVDRHTHTIYLTANTPESGSAYSSTAGSAESVEPAYKKTGVIKNDTGGPSKPKGIIGMWLGALSAIPQGWFLCNGLYGTPDLRDKFIKVASTTGEHGNTGGSNTHTHAASNSHTHTAAGTHSHSGSTDYFSQAGSTGANSNGVSKDHSHPSTSCSSATSSWASATIQADSTDNQPAFRTVQYIQYQRELQGGAFFFGLVN